MCSIAGFYCYGQKRPSINSLKGLMLASQTRGKSAAGMAYLDSKGVAMIRKQAGPAENLVAGMPEKDWAEVARSPRALFHARATTKGTEKDNENNHPVSQYGWIVTHNGQITNDDDLFTHYGAERYAAVDTAAVPLVLKQGESFDDSLRHLSLLAGQASLAMWSLEKLDTIALAKLGTNDVYLFFDPVADIVYWCSTPIAGKILPGFTLGNMAFFTIGKLNENRIMILEPTKEKARLLKVERSPFLVHRSRVFHAEATPIPNGGEITGGQKALPVHQPHPLDRIGLVARVLGRTHTKPTRDFTWIQRDETWKTKPLIDSSGVASMWFDWKALILYFSAQFMAHGNIESTLTMYTGYGRWVFVCKTPVTPEQFTTTFLPAKRIKKFWRRHFNDKLPDLKLPVVLGTLDRVMLLEEFSFADNTPTVPPGKLYTMGWMCPWCGITMQTLQWHETENRCPGCGVISESIATIRTGGA